MDFKNILFFILNAIYLLGLFFIKLRPFTIIEKNIQLIKHNDLLFNKSLFFFNQYPSRNDLKAVVKNEEDIEIVLRILKKWNKFTRYYLVFFLIYFIALYYLIF